MLHIIIVANYIYKDYLTLSRIKIIIEYDGSPFCGWQRQQNALSIQECLERALYHFTGQHLTVFGAGRTDAGVHAKGQVAHFDLPREYPLAEVISALNHHLRPHPIVVLHAEKVDDHFHARFNAICREYVYQIINRSAPLALAHKRAWHIREELSAQHMHEAAQVLIGQHDFSSFRHAHCQASSPVKTLTSISVIRQDELISIYLAAPSFLHNQVRIIVGCLRQVGRHAWDKAKLAAVLQAKDRKQAAETAPAYGLYFTKVSY